MVWIPCLGYAGVCGNKRAHCLGYAGVCGNKRAHCLGYAGVCGNKWTHSLASTEILEMGRVEITGGGKWQFFEKCHRN